MINGEEEEEEEVASFKCSVFRKEGEVKKSRVSSEQKRKTGVREGEEVFRLPVARCFGEEGKVDRLGLGFSLFYY